eukprot:SM000222S06976  [mRNA]  locus=s222:133582:136074:+ [translate_table: standard]
MAAEPFDRFAFVAATTSRRRTPGAKLQLPDGAPKPCGAPTTAAVMTVASEGPSAVRRRPKRSAGGATATVEPGPPAGWEIALDAISRALREMRVARDAPVDIFNPRLRVLHSMRQLVDRAADDKTRRFQALVAAVISSQTRDAVTGAAMARLRALPGGLCVDQVASPETPLELLAETLKPVGFYRQKAKHLKAIAEILSRAPHNGCVPSSLDELVKLPGVGPKIGLLILLIAFDKQAPSRHQFDIDSSTSSLVLAFWPSVAAKLRPFLSHLVSREEGIIVDSNVRRVCERLGWALPGLDADVTRAALERWLPPGLWAEFSLLLVGFGQQVCRPLHPKCHECKLQHSCPSAKQFIGAGVKGRSKRPAVQPS